MELYEKNVVVKLFHNKSLHPHLKDILPNLFVSPTRRYIVFLMRELYLHGKTMTLENLVLQQGHQTAVAYLKKKNMQRLNLEDFQDILCDFEIDAKPDLFKEAYDELHYLTFAEYAGRLQPFLERELAYKNKAGVLAVANAVTRYHKVLYASRTKQINDGITDAVNEINKGNSYIRLFSPKLTSMMGGVSRGFPSAIGGKPSHCKSTLLTNFIRNATTTKEVNRIDVISSEEPQSAFWRRIFALEFKLSISALRGGLQKITPEQLKFIKDKYDGCVFFHRESDFRGVLDIISNLKSDLVFIDHINAIAYPENGNQIKYIPVLINAEKEWLSRNPESAIVNFTQVNTKNLIQRRVLVPSRSDFYCSSVLEQACREILIVYYEYKDYTSEDTKALFLGKRKVTPAPDRLAVIADKNSYGDVGQINYDFNPDTGEFADSKETPKKLNVILPDTPFQLF